MIVCLDSTPASLLTNPDARGEALACLRWFDSLLEAGVTVFLPAIVDYELRRELLRARKLPSVALLDDLGVTANIWHLTPPALRQAAHLWASARQGGRPTASDASLDVDVILAAQALEIEQVVGGPVVVATSNIRHLGLFVDAGRWQDITAD